MSKLGRYRKAIAGVVGTLAVVAASIPTNADPKLIALGGLVTSLAVLVGPANDPKPVKTVDPPPRPLSDR